MAKSFFNRYVWLIDTIRRHGHITFREIDDEWRRSSLNDTREPFPERTFLNHLKSILDPFDIEIKNDRQRGYYISDSGDIGNSVRQWLLEAISLNRVLRETKSALRDRVLLEHVPTISHLIPLIETLQAGNCVELRYQKFHDDEPIVFVAHPYCLKFFRQRWYLLARRDDLDELRTYALDRILDLKPTKQSAVVPADFDAGGHFEQYFGIFTGMNVEPCAIVLRVTNREAQYLDTLPLHHSQFKVEANDTHTTYRYRLAPTYDFRMELLSRGAAVEVLQPEWFRAEVKQHIEAMMQNYE